MCPRHFWISDYICVLCFMSLSGSSPPGSWYGTSLAFHALVLYVPSNDNWQLSGCLALPVGCLRCLLEVKYIFVHEELPRVIYHNV